ncbi:GMC family oxidoreductase [Halioxenophilus aromaticivorans]|uniref:Choline dehydrogenase n=1 Tax=Halioxenophilus aromaticivorans TaxID=1306992 RepID=A0AAV3U6P3_9ALTE
MIYDYIIVGAGSAGCVLADALSETGKHQVLVIESGPKDDSFLLTMPRGIGKILHPESPYVWQYDVDKGLAQFTRGDNNKETWLKGRVLGGSSSINGMVYARGFAHDYDQWETLGCNGWNWHNLRPHFMAHEQHELGSNNERGADGPLRITVHPKNDNGQAVRHLSDAILHAMADNGITTTDDTNDNGGAGYQPRTIFQGKRCSAAKAFLKPAMHRHNLTVMHDTTVQKILFNENRAIGVELKHNGNIIRKESRRDIILSAGAIESPKLLMLSGIGDRAHLTDLKIPLVQHAPEVGQNLQEHFYIHTRFRVRKGSLNKAFQGVGLIKSLCRYLLTHKGPFSHAAHELIAYSRSQPNITKPDCQIGVGLYSLIPQTFPPQPDKFPGITIGGYPLHPTSRGHLRLQSAQPQVAPKILANFLNTEDDKKTAVALLRQIRSIAQQSALADHIEEELNPGVNATSDEQLLAYYQNYGGTAYHVAGTCRMGSDPGAVVDTRTKVCGVEGLRVVDTSIFPRLPSGNTNAPTMAVARFASSLILADAR